MKAKLIFNLIAFELGWLACVMGGAHQLPWLGTGLAAMLIAIHLSFALRPKPELILILVSGAIGAVWDSLLVALGWLAYPSGTLFPGTAPHWIIAMWMLLATTLNISLRWLHRRWLLAASLGAIAGPLAYYGGYRLGGVDFQNMSLALLIIAGSWALWMPLLIALAEHFDGIRPKLTKTAFA